MAAADSVVFHDKLLGDATQRYDDQLLDIAELRMELAELTSRRRRVWRKVDKLLIMGICCLFVAMLCAFLPQTYAIPIVLAAAVWVSTMVALFFVNYQNPTF
jgi:hypothetical protein